MKYYVVFTRSSFHSKIISFGYDDLYFHLLLGPHTLESSYYSRDSCIESYAFYRTICPKTLLTCAFSLEDANIGLSLYEYMQVDQLALMYDRQSIFFKILHEYILQPPWFHFFYTM